MAEAGKPKSFFDFKPLTQDNLLYHYAPAMGAYSYTLLSVSLSNPKMLRRFFPTHDTVTALLLTSITGTALYIYKRPHLERASNKLRITYSIYGASMLSLSSVLLWAILRLYLPDNWAIQNAIGVASSFGLLRLGKEYLDLVDKK